MIFVSSHFLAIRCSAVSRRTAQLTFRLRQTLSFRLLLVQILIVDGLTEELVDFGVGGEQVVLVENLTVVHHIIECRCAQVLRDQRTVAHQTGVQEIGLIVGEQIVAGIVDVTELKIAIQNLAAIDISNRPRRG